jgi:hypothetical protein
MRICPAITVPVLCQRTRDSFCDQALMEQVLTRLGGNWRMHWIPKAITAFSARSARGARIRRPDVGDVCRAWIGKVR